MPSIVVIGAQWGDEGKARVVDYVAAGADIIVRYQGGNNAGHTVVVGEEEFKLHLVPAGILYAGKLCLIANGVYLDPKALLAEMHGLEKRGVDTRNLRVSDRAQVVMPYHLRLDELEEVRRGLSRLGTTKLGIGPTAADKYYRMGIRVSDLLEPDELAAKLELNLSFKNKVFNLVYGSEGFDYDALYSEYLSVGERLAPLVTDTSALLHQALQSGKRVLFEGAQGTLLDVDHGTYPYVTSSHPVSGGACLGAGLGPKEISMAVGVSKAYTTRVGEGPFPTELQDEIGNQIREKGREYGTTTGRPRRCGWLDLVALRYAIRVNGLDGLALTKLDVLDDLPVIKVCVGYRLGDQVIMDFPASLATLADCVPVYEELEGWCRPTSGARNENDLPPQARAYLDRIAKLAGAELVMVSVGPRRTETVFCRDLWVDLD
ncbi:MAG: adenylosuccinate synthase [Firmicutes bacterium]|nr:adenylosuccinate synthase [Bacillota bacterium]